MLYGGLIRQDQGYAQEATRSPCRGRGLAMRGGPAALESAQGATAKGLKPSLGIFRQVANTRC